MSKPNQLLTSPSALKRLLQAMQILPQKGLGQHFLVDSNILRKLVEVAQVQPADRVLEIGPGPGALTQALLDTGAHLLAVEKDPLLAEQLLRLQTEDKRLVVACADFLSFPLPQTKRPLKVVANLPYLSSRAILQKLLPLSPSISTLTLMMQWEVAQKMLAAVRSTTYGPLALLVQSYASARICFKVAPTCFYPPPKVWSAVVHLTLQRPPAADMEGLFALIQRAFRQRRKRLTSSLQNAFPTQVVHEALATLGLRQESRPHELTLRHFIELFENIQTGAGQSRPRSEREEIGQREGALRDSAE